MEDFNLETKGIKLLAIGHIFAYRCFDKQT